MQNRKKAAQAPQVPTPSSSATKPTGKSLRGISPSQKPLLYIIMPIIFFLIIGLYCHDESNLKGEWILDDKVSILQNPTVIGELPWSEIWTRDFWGKDSLSLARSHKSWRPLCTATYRLNYIFSSNGVAETYWWHVVDRSIYAIVAALALPVAAYTFLHMTTTKVSKHSSSSLFWSATIFATLFYGVHPIHVESVANSTGRAEVLCGLFYFLGFLCYARFGSGVKLIQSGKESEPSVGWLGLIGLILCTAAAMLSKEHGITLPVLCVLWDAYIGTNTSIPELFQSTFPLNSSTRRIRQCRYFLIRTFLCAIGTFYLAVWRIAKNGPYSSDFSCEQNPGACQPNPITKLLHFSYLWCFNFWLMLYPANLSADWTGDSIPILNSLYDPRIMAVVALWIILALAVYHFFISAFEAPPTNQDMSKLHRRTVLVAFLWMMIPFLMSSNLFVYIGLTIADRTLFLPSFGFCLIAIQGLIYSSDFLVYVLSGANSHITGEFSIDFVKNFAVIILAFYVSKQQSYTKIWSRSVTIWCESNRVAPGSIMAERECGLSLVNVNRSMDAIPKLERSLRRAVEYPLGAKTTNDIDEKKKKRSRSERKQQEWTHMKSLMQTRFIVTHAMAHGGRCDRALPLLDEGLSRIDKVLEELGKELMSSKNTKDYENTRFYTFQEIQVGLTTEQAALLVTKSKCVPDLAAMWELSMKALDVRGDNPNVIDHVMKVKDLVERAKQMNKDTKDIKLIWLPKGNGYDLSFM